jgi:hypothetical protein
LKNGYSCRSADALRSGTVDAMDMGEVLGNILAGCVVAIVVAVIAWLGTERFAQRQEAARARRERDLAAAEELYGVYGQFFATWKAWEFARGRRTTEKGKVQDEVRQELLWQAAQVEGRYESLIVRVALEHRLSPGDRTALWSLRFALKELRRAIRDDAPLGWWRTDDPANPEVHGGAQRYSAFKDLAPKVASIFVDADPRSGIPSTAERRAALVAITATMSPEDSSRPSRLKGSQWHKALAASSEPSST